MKPSLPVLLSVNGGYVDAAGYLALHGLFTTHVTGNFVTLGAALVLGTSGDPGAPVANVPQRDRLRRRVCGGGADLCKAARLVLRAPAAYRGVYPVVGGVNSGKNCISSVPICLWFSMYSVGLKT